MLWILVWWKVKVALNQEVGEMLCKGWKRECLLFYTNVGFLINFPVTLASPVRTGIQHFIFFVYLIFSRSEWTIVVWSNIMGWCICSCVLHWWEEKFNTCSLPFGNHFHPQRTEKVTSFTPWKQTWFGSCKANPSGRWSGNLFEVVMSILRNFCRGEFGWSNTSISILDPWSQSIHSFQISPCCTKKNIASPNHVQSNWNGVRIQEQSNSKWNKP